MGGISEGTIGVTRINGIPVMYDRKHQKDLTNKTLI